MGFIGIIIVLGLFFWAFEIVWKVGEDLFKTVFSVAFWERIGILLVLVFGTLIIWDLSTNPNDIFSLIVIFLEIYIPYKIIRIMWDISGGTDWKIALKKLW